LSASSFSEADERGAGVSSILLTPDEERSAQSKGGTGGLTHVSIDKLRVALAAEGSPLPIPPIPLPPEPSTRSGGARSRYRRALLLREEAERIRTTINDLGEAQCADDSGPVGRRRLRQCDLVADDHYCRPWKLLLDRAKRMAEGTRAQLTGDNPIRDLRRKAGDLYVDSGGASYVPFLAHLVAEPPLGAATVDMMRWLPSDLSVRYAAESQLFREPEVVEATLKAMNRRFTSVLGEHSEYVRYLCRPEVRELWDLEAASCAVATCSIASVMKSDGISQRKILMVCPMNDAIKSVEDFIAADPGYGLVSGTALSQARPINGQLCVGSVDESNAFTPVIVPTFWRRLQAGPRIRARDLPPDWVGGRFAPSDWVRPQYRRLAMGHTHAVYILMKINEMIVSDAAIVLRRSAQLAVCYLNVQAVRDRGIVLDAATVGVYVHVDDFGVVGAFDSCVDATLDELGKQIRRRGFMFTLKQSGSVDRFVGLTPQVSPPAWLPRLERLCTLGAALLQVAAWRAVSARILQVVVAHYVHWGILWRPSLSVPHAVYQFITVHFDDPEAQPIWPSVRRELVMMRGLLPLLRADLSRPLSDTVLAQDAAGPSEDAACRTGAFCLAAGTPPSSDIAVLGRRLELQGKAILPIHKLDSDIGLICGTSVVPRTILPASWFSDDAGWELLLARRWKWPMHINLGEARAGLAWLVALCRLPIAEGVDFIDLSDNLVTVGIWRHGRSSVYSLNQICRRRAAHEGAFGTRLLMTWIDTLHQPADGGTRPDVDGRLRLERPLWLSCRVFLELFACDSGVTDACDAAGVETWEAWSVNKGPRFNLLDDKNVRRLLRLVGSGHVAFLWVNAPHGTFAKGRRPRLDVAYLRLHSWPHLPRHDIDERSIQCVKNANLLVDVCILACDLVHRRGGVFVIACPLISQLWNYNHIIEFTAKLHVSPIHVGCGTLGTPSRHSIGLCGTLPGLESLKFACNNLACALTNHRRHAVSHACADEQRAASFGKPYPACFLVALGDIVKAYVDGSS
jgi:hypothetical protein